MCRTRLIFLVALAIIQFDLSAVLIKSSFAQEWEFQRPKGILKVVDLDIPSLSAKFNYSEPLVARDRNDNWVPCLAEDWRWLNDRTIEFKLREGVKFHNGEKFNADSVILNWEHYRLSKKPFGQAMWAFGDGTELEKIGEYTVRFTFPEPEGLLFVKLQYFTQIAPAFFKDHKFDENDYAFLPEPGPWGTGPFKLVEGNLKFMDAGPRVVLVANENYWDRRYPKVQKVIFENDLEANRKEAMRLCSEAEGAVDIIVHMRPLDTLQVAKSPHAKVVKKKDLGRLGCWFNLRKKNSKWKDIRLRKALNYAVNREELRRYCAKGNAHSLGIFPPVGAPGYHPDLVPYTYDTAKARELLAEAGYPDGFEVKIITRDAWELEGNILIKMWERIGLKVKMDALNEIEFMAGSFISMLSKPPEEVEWDIQLYRDSDWNGHTAVSFFTYMYLETSGMRWIEYDPVFEKMYKKMARTVDGQKQEDLIKEMAIYLYDQVYQIYIYSPIRLHAVNKEVNFLPEMIPYLRLKETSVTENHWSVPYCCINNTTESVERQE